jgi:6-pyruvoyltetrahydropterin/6-carboxytetrahydropterin synthase
MDFGDLSEMKKWLDDKFDHTLLLDQDDPLLGNFRTLEKMGACKLTVFNDVGMEGTSKYVFDYAQEWVQSKTQGRVSIVSVEVRENDKNSAKFESSGTYYVG